MEIKEIAQELFDTEQKIAEEKARRSALEGQLIGQIVKEGRFDLFSVNWRRLHTEVYGQPGTKR